MAIKELQTRIALKYDSYSAWTTAPGKDLVLLKGELGICHIGDANQGSNVVPTVLFKVGDGTSTFEQLPWASAKAADVYSWAKASEVKRDGKKLVFVGGVVNADGTRSNLEVPFDYVTLAEVKEITDDLTTRIAAVEAKFSGDASVEGQISALDARLDVLEGEGAGSVKKAEADAKAYTDTREAAIKTAYEAYADQAEADAIAAAEAKVATERARIAAVEGDVATIKGEGAGSIKKAVADAVTEVKAYADTAEADAVTTAKAYTDEREVEINKAIAQAEADAKKHADDELASAVGTINAKDSAQDAEIAKKLDAATYTAYIAGKSMSDEELKAYADGKASAAQSAAETNAATTAQGKVDALANGQVKVNKEAIAAMDAAYKAADTTLGNRITEVEGKLANVSNVMDFIGARTVAVSDEGVITVTAVDNETFNKGDVVVDNGGKEFVYDGEAWHEFGYADGNTAAIETLKGRMDTAEDDIDQAQADISALEEAVGTKLATETFNTWKGTHEADHAKTATEITTEITTAVNGEKSAREAADLEINTKIGANGDAATANTVYGAIADAKKTGEDAAAAAAGAVGRLDIAEPKITTLQNIVNGYSETGSIKAAVEAAQNAADAAQDAADKAQGEVDTLEGVVSTLRGEYDVTKALATTNEAAISALTSRVGTAEGNITTLQGIVATGNDSNAKLREAITDLQGIVKTGADANAALRSDLTTLQGVVNHATTGLAATKAIADEAKSDAEDAQGRVAAIEADYLKAADAYIFNCGTSTTIIHEQSAE